MSVGCLQYFRLESRVQDPREAAEGKFPESIVRDLCSFASLSLFEPYVEIRRQVQILIDRIILELLIVKSIFEGLFVVAALKDIQCDDRILIFFLKSDAIVGGAHHERDGHKVLHSEHAVLHGLFR